MNDLGIELPCNINDLPDMSEADKTKLVDEGVKAAGQALLTVMLACKIQNFIRGSFQDGNGNRYDLLITRTQGAIQSK